MAYFSYGSRRALNFDNQLLECPPDPTARLTQLHRVLYDRMRAQSWDLHPYWEGNRVVTYTSTAGGFDTNVHTLVYLRSEEQARMVEENMGIESRGRGYTGIRASRHPVIEVRDAADHFAVELIISPEAWWDQQNIVGKLALERYRTGLRSLLRGMRPDYCFGFWAGTQLNDMHLTTWQLTQGNVLSEWLGTFADSHDYLRFGAWYDRDDPALAPERLANEIYGRLADLYTLYEFLVWTGNNNFRSFYEKQHSRQRRYA